MSWINRLERRLEPFAITNLTLFIVIGQAFVLLTSMLQLIDPLLLVLIPSYVTAGEWWRVFSFVFIPQTWSPLFAAFALYLLYLYGSALEHHWGALRYNFFLLNGFIMTAGLAFFAPYSASSNYYILVSVFLAFAWLNPNFELLLFFVLPVKIKWLGLLAWANFAYDFITGGTATKFAVAASVGNFLLFFGADLIRALRQKGRRQHSASLGRTGEKSSNTDARHTCSVCKRTEITNPELDFRYSADDQCYCSDHLPNRKSPAPTSSGSASSDTPAP